MLEIFGSIVGAILFGVFGFYIIRYLKRYLDSSREQDCHYDFERLSYLRFIALSLEKIALSLDDLSKMGTSPKNKED